MSLSATPSFKLRASFSVHYLPGAMHMAALAGEVEKKLAGAQVMDVAHWNYVVSSILLAVAYLESTVNELFLDAMDESSPYILALPKHVRTALGSYWHLSGERDNRFTPMLQKYQLSLILAGVQVFDKGAQPFQDADLVVRLRNYLTHYKPHWYGEGIKHDLGEELQRRNFPPNRLMQGQRNPWFPDHCLGQGCAEWAIGACRLFTDEYFRRINLHPKKLSQL